MPNPKQPEVSPEEKDMQQRVQLFDQEFQAIQRKYSLRVVAQLAFPGGALLTVPIQVFPIPQAPTAAAETATKPE